MEAISHAGLALGILCQDGIILAAERRMVSEILEAEQPASEKIYKIDRYQLMAYLFSHIVAAVAGITSDANLLVNFLRGMSQKHRVVFQDPISPESIVTKLCDMKQGYTQKGGLRPFGVSFLYAGYDDYYGFQLYQSDPSGNYSSWKATSIGIVPVLI